MKRQAVVTQDCTPVPAWMRRALWRIAYESLPIEVQVGATPEPAATVVCGAGKPAATREPRGWSPNAAAQPLLDAGTRTAPPATDFPAPPADVPEVIPDPEAYGRAYAEAEAASAGYTD